MLLPVALADTAPDAAPDTHSHAPANTRADPHPNAAPDPHPDAVTLSHFLTNRNITISDVIDSSYSFADIASSAKPDDAADSCTDTASSASAE